MRILDIVASPPLVIFGWLAAIIIAIFVFRRLEPPNNRELSRFAVLGAFIFVVQIIVIPYQVIFPFFAFLTPIQMNISGVALIVGLVGLKRGLVIGFGVSILVHVVTFTSIGMMGVNLSLMAVCAVIVSLLPTQRFMTKEANRRFRWGAAFLSGFVYVVVQGILILILIDRSYDFHTDPTKVALGAMVLFIIHGILEGFFTGLVSSYYFRAEVDNEPQWEEGEDEESDDDYSDDGLGDVFLSEDDD